jgi:hypothetical protein
MTNAVVVTATCLGLGSLLTWGGVGPVQRALAAYLTVIVGINLCQAAGVPTVTPTTFVVQELLAMSCRYVVVFGVLRGVFSPLPGAQRVAARLTLISVVGAAAILAWGLMLPAGPRGTFRALALANGGAGALLLALRVLTLHYYLPVHPLQRLTMTWFGVYLVLRSLLLGAATEWSAVFRVRATAVSSVAWCVWALALAWATWTGQNWRRPQGVPP